MAAPAPKNAITSTDSHCRFGSLAEQAALTIEGEEYARAYLGRLKSETQQPGELAVLVAFLRGAMLQGACSVIEKALRGCHG